MVTRVVLAAALMLFMLPGCSGNREEVAAVARPEISGVVVERVSTTEVETYQEVPGTVMAASSSMVASRLMGTVVEVPVSSGDRVAAGQLLARLDDREMKARMAQARAVRNEASKGLAMARENRNLAETTYNRFQALFAEKALSRQELDKVATQRRVAVLEYERALEMQARADAGVREAEVALAFTRITAPVSGLVSSRTVDPGSMALPGVPLFTVEDTSSFRVEARVAEAHVGALAPGMAVEVRIPAENRRLAGTVSEVVPSLDPRSRTFLVKVAVSGEGLASGQFARVRFPRAREEVLLLPTGAVVRRGQLTGVYLVQDNQVVTYRLVRIGRRYENKVELLSGIRANDRVVVAGLERVKDGGILNQGEGHE